MSETNNGGMCGGGCGTFILAVAYAIAITALTLSYVIIPGVACQESVKTKSCEQFRHRWTGKMYKNIYDSYTQENEKGVR